MSTFESIFNHKYASILTSCVIGFGFALMFRRVCNGAGCVIIRRHPGYSTENVVYKTGDKCAMYKPVAVECES